MKRNNENLLPIISQITNLEEVTSEQLLEVTQSISDNINLNKLKSGVTTACKTLSGVGAPFFMSNAKALALDNQKRLELVYMLLDSYERIEADIKNFRRNKLDCRENDDYLINFIFNTQKVLMTIQEYGDFRIQEHIENEKYIKTLQANEQKLLNKGGK